jgi:hypothetical protein
VHICCRCPSSTGRGTAAVTAAVLGPGHKRRIVAERRARRSFIARSAHRRSVREEGYGHGRRAFLQTVSNVRGRDAIADSPFEHYVVDRACLMRRARCAHHGPMKRQPVEGKR